MKSFTCIMPFIIVWVWEVCGIFFKTPRSIIDINKRRFQSVIRLKAGKPGEEYVWYYSGLVRNPLTGGEFIGIEGLEFSKALSLKESPVYDSNHEISSNLSDVSSNSIDGVNHQYSYISRKMFIYTDNTNRTRPLTSYRIRPPHSPLRKINSPIKILHEMVTFGTHMSGQVFAVIQYPSGRKVHSGNMAVSSEDGGASSWLSWGRRGRARIELTCFLYAKRKQKMNKWVSVSSASDGAGRSQEYYTYIDDGPMKTPYMICRRFGECPPWFAPGRSCSTELRAVRYNSVNQIPKHKLKLFQESCPDFFNIPLSPKTFRNGTDLLDGYRPWYKGISKFSGTKALWGFFGS